MQKKNTFCEKQQNKTKQNRTKQNKTKTLAKQAKPLTTKKTVAKNKTLQKQQNKLQLFFARNNKTEQKTKPHHSFERKPLFLEKQKNLLLKDNLISDQNPSHLLKETFPLTEKPQKRNYHFIKKNRKTNFQKKKTLFLKKTQHFSSKKKLFPKNTMV